MENICLLLLIAVVSFFGGWFIGRHFLRKQLFLYISAIEMEQENECTCGKDEGVVDEDDSEPWDSDPDFWKNR